MQIGSSSFGGTTQTINATGNTLLTTNGFGFFVEQADFSFTSIAWSGAGFVTLSNACTSGTGCSVSNPIYWDENSGGSTAYENTIGSIPSEAFTLTGGCGGGGGVAGCGPGP